MSASEPATPNVDLAAAYESRLPLLEQLASALESETTEALAGLLHIDRIAFRVKAPSSFASKAVDPATEPHYSEPLVEIEDQVAGRVLVFFLSDITPIEERLRNTFNTVERSHRRPEKDDEFGYESHHLICMIPPQLKPAGWEDRDDLPTTFELQLRTLFMHAWAEPQHDLDYKGVAELSRELKRELSWIAASAWGADQAFDRVWRSQITQT